MSTKAKMTTITFDDKFINTNYTTNKIYTNTVHLGCIIGIEKFPKDIIKTTDDNGSTRRQTVYNVSDCNDIKFYNRQLSQMLRQKLGQDYDVIMMSKRAQFWQRKDLDPQDYVNAVRYQISINNKDEKCFVTIILTNIDEPDDTEETVTTTVKQTITDDDDDEEYQLKPRTKRFFSDTEDIKAGKY